MTVEQRIDRLERSCWRWRFSCIAAVVVAALLGATTKPSVLDGHFNNITASQLTIRDPGGGPAYSVSTDGAQTSMQITGGAGSAIVVVDKDGANVFLSHNGAKGMTSANIGTDDVSGTVGLRNVAGKTKEIEPE